MLSTQVLSEFFVTVTPKLPESLSPAEAEAVVERLTQVPVVALDAPLVRAAIATSQISPISYSDALILEAAAAAGCDRLLTEDLGDGDSIRGVRIENPVSGTSPPPRHRYTIAG